MIDYKEIINFGKGKLAIMIYAHSIAFLFVDIIKLKYWQYAMIFIPINFFISYYVSKRVFHNEKRNKKIL